MQVVADEYGDQVVVMGVNAGDSPEDARTYASNFDIRYTLALDTQLEITEAYAVRQMPTSVFIDEHGVVASVIYGVIVPDQMRENIDAMIAASDPASVYRNDTFLVASPQRVSGSRDVWRHLYSGLLRQTV
jgi:peroxiredoxin